MGRDRSFISFVDARRIRGRGLDASYGRVDVLVVVGLVSRSMSSSRGTTIADDDDAWETTNAWRRHHNHVVSCHHWDE